MRVTNNFAVPRTCPGQHFLQAVLSSLCIGSGGEGQRLAEASPQPFVRWIPTASIPFHGCSGCRGGWVMLTRRSSARALLLSSSHPSHLSMRVGRQESPHSCAPALAGWEERSPMGWPHCTWGFMPEPPWSPAPGPCKALASAGFGLRGYPESLCFPSLLHVTSRQAANPPAHRVAAAAG